MLSLKLQFLNVCLLRLIVTGDNHGRIKFYDSRVKILYWLQNFELPSISSISFDLNKFSYQLKDPTEGNNQAVGERSKLQLFFYRWHGISAYTRQWRFRRQVRRVRNHLQELGTIRLHPAKESICCRKFCSVYVSIKYIQSPNKTGEWTKY